jgi:hypothetical protein
MNPEHVKSFVTYYLQNLSERTRREKTGTKWGIDWIAYNIGLARFGKTVRLPFLRHGSGGFPKSKTEAEFGIDVAFVSEDGSELIVFVLKDEPLTNTTWTANGFDRDLRMAITPDLGAPDLEHVTRVTITLAYNKDDNQNGIEIYDRFVAAAPTTVGDKVALHFVRWNLSSNDAPRSALTRSSSAARMAATSRRFRRLGDAEAAGERSGAEGRRGRSEVER